MESKWNGKEWDVIIEEYTINEWIWIQYVAANLKIEKAKSWDRI